MKAELLLTILRRSLAIALIAPLTGCVVYPAGTYSTGYQAPTYVDGQYVGVQPVYSAPNPVYVPPPTPAYVAPPVYFGFGLNYWSGGGHWHGGRGGWHHGGRGR